MSLIIPMSGTKKYKTTKELQRVQSVRATQRHIRLSHHYTKNKFGGLVNKLAAQGGAYKKTVEMIKHTYQVVGKGEQGALIKMVTAGLQGKNNKFVKDLNKMVLKEGFTTVFKDLKSKLQTSKRKDTEGGRYYQKIAQKQSKGKQLTKAERMHIKQQVQREVYVSRMKAALQRADLTAVLRKLLEDSLKAMGLL